MTKDYFDIRLIHGMRIDLERRIKQSLDNNFNIGSNPKDVEIVQGQVVENLDERLLYQKVEMSFLFNGDLSTINLSTYKKLHLPINQKNVVCGVVNSFIVDSSGKVVFGGLHHSISELTLIDDALYLVASNKEGDLFNLYCEDGSVLESFGGSHYYIHELVEICNEKYLIVRHRNERGISYYREDGSIAFGGVHLNTIGSKRINGIPYLHALPDKGGVPGFYQGDGTLYNSFVEAGLSQIEEEISSSGLGNSFYQSFNRVIGSITSDNILFLEGVINHVKELYKKNDETTFKRGMKQFIQCLEYFASHPNEALGFVGGVRR